MNRFRTKNNHFAFLPHINFGLLLGPILLLLFFYGVSSVGNTQISKQKESLETALTRDITHCYAVEGMYPPNLAYIEEHYGLTYDKDLFFVDYQPIGANLRPDITIIEKESSR